MSIDPYLEMRLEIFRGELLSAVGSMAGARESAYRNDLNSDYSQAYFPSNSATLPYTNFYAINNAVNPPTVTFTAGSVKWGKLLMVVGDAGPHAILDGYYWGIKVTYSSGGSTAAWISSATEGTFDDTDDSVAKWYYKFSVVSNKAAIDKVAAVGNWSIPSIFAPEIS